MEDRVSAVADNLSLSTMQWAEKKKNEERGMFCGFCRYIDNEDKMLERKRRDATQSQVREREEESANHTTAPSQLPPRTPVTRHRCFLALALTLVSNTLLRMAVCAV